VSGVALLARLAQRGRRRNLKQVAGGALVTVLSAAWAWRSGQASNFYATGLVINAVCLLAFLGSLLLRRPLIGVLMELWHPTSGGDAESPSPASGSSWRTDPARAGIRRRYAIATGVLAAVFVLRLLVEVPLYLAGEAALGALGVSRVVLGLPLYGLGIWFAWLIVRPSSQRANR
jgi:integral membrane protein